jgi:opacity protein-like surface antigen
MANIPIWPGSASFDATLTPFSFYDSDTDFQTDAVNVADWCAKRLGYPLVDIELQAANFFTAFEEATNEYGKQLYDFQIINNFQTLEGNTTGSNFNNNLITPNMGGTINVSEQYGNETDGGGGDYEILRGSLKVLKGASQRYDLLTSTSSSISGSEAVYIKRIYHYPPAAINRYFDPYAGTGTGIQSLMQTFGFGNFSPGVNFMLMPLSFDIQKLQAIELNDTIRKSGYHFTIEDNRYLRLYPIPTRDYTMYFDYQLKSVANNPIKNTANNLITDISNVPYTNPTYAFINQPGRQWIRKYALALSKEMLGGVRGKYQSLPIPGETTTLDYTRLLSEASAEKEKLIEELKAILEETTRLKQLERKNQEAQQTQETYYKIPYHIYIG